MPSPFFTISLESSTWIEGNKKQSQSFAKLHPHFPENWKHVCISKTFSADFSLYMTLIVFSLGLFLFEWLFMDLNSCVYNGVELTPSFLICSFLLLGLNFIPENIRLGCFTYTPYLLNRILTKIVIKSYV